MSRRTTRTLAVPALALALAVGAVACGEDETPAADRATTTTAAAADGGGSGGSGGDEVSRPVVKIGPTDDGDVLLDGDGNALYLFTPDDRGRSTCLDACAEAWPPLLAPEAGAVAGNGVSASQLNTIQRPDGTLQVTYANWPLYRYAGDAEAGQTTGQGSGGVWFLVKADGEALDAGAAADPGY